MIVSIVLILTVATLCIVIYKQRTTNIQLHNEITTNSEAICELESHTYYSESDIESIVEDKTNDLQYTLEDHGSSISTLEDNTVTMDEIDELKIWITKGEDKILEKVRFINNKLADLFPDAEPEEKELIQQERIDDIVSVTVRTGRYTKRDDGQFRLREQDEISCSLSDIAKEELTELLMKLAKEDEFMEFNNNTYKGDEDEMGFKAAKKAPAKKLSQKTSF